MKAGGVGASEMAVYNLVPRLNGIQKAKGLDLGAELNLRSGVPIFLSGGGGKVPSRRERKSKDA